jgi:hypothetical protein
MLVWGLKHRANINWKGTKRVKRRWERNGKTKKDES